MTVNNGCDADTLSLVSSTFDANYIYYLNENTVTGTFPATPAGTAP